MSKAIQPISASRGGEFFFLKLIKLNENDELFNVSFSVF